MFLEITNSECALLPLNQGHHSSKSDDAQAQTTYASASSSDCAPARRPPHSSCAAMEQNKEIETVAISHSLGGAVTAPAQDEADPASVHHPGQQITGERTLKDARCNESISVHV